MRLPKLAQRMVMLCGRRLRLQTDQHMLTRCGVVSQSELPLSRVVAEPRSFRSSETPVRTRVVRRSPRSRSSPVVRPVCGGRAMGAAREIPCRFGRFSTSLRRSWRPEFRIRRLHSQSSAGRLCRMRLRQGSRRDRDMGAMFELPEAACGDAAAG